VEITDATILHLVTEGLLTVIYVAAPPLAMGLTAGLIMSIFQTVTSIQEPTLAFIPKILAVLGSLIIFGPFMLGRLIAYFNFLLTFISDSLT
jgi:flagellar biosynthetic protein FliQ